MQKSQVTLGDVVWAKLGNWPWWPSKVEQIDPDEKKPVIVRFFAYKNNDLGFMEYRQLQPFRRFFSEGAKQKGKLLTTAVELAESYLSKQRIEAAEPLEEVPRLENLPKTYEESTGESLMVDSKQAELPLDNEKKMVVSCQNNKISQENLKKRKPVIKSAEPNSIKTKRLQAKKPDSNKELLEVKPLKEQRKLSSSGLPLVKAVNQPVNEQLAISQIAFEQIEPKEIVGLVDSLAETLSSIRDRPAHFTKSHRDCLYAKLNEFCCFCRNKNDEDLRELVRLKIGIYLTAILHLLKEVNEFQNPFFEMVIDNVPQILTILKQKALRNFARLTSVEEIQNSQKHTQPEIENPYLDLPLEKTKSSEATDNVSTHFTVDPKQSIADKIKIEMPQMESLSSEIQSSTIKQEELTEEKIRFKMRRKVCKKIRAILHEELGLKLTEAEKYTLIFEQAVFTAFTESIREYIQAIKTICNRVRAKKLPVSILEDISKADHSSIKTYLLQFSTHC